MRFMGILHAILSQSAISVSCAELCSLPNRMVWGYVKAIIHYNKQPSYVPYIIFHVPLNVIWILHTGLINFMTII